MSAAWLVAAIASTAAFLTAPASGAIVYLTQQRSIEANGFVNAQPEGGGPLNAQNFGEFNRTRMHTFSSGAGSVSASQRSTLMPNQVSMNGAVQVTIAGGAELDAMAHSRLMVTFDLTESSPFVVDHAHFMSGAPGQRWALAQLTGPGGTVFNWYASNLQASNWPNGPFAGTLESGVYSLKIETFVSRGINPPNLGTTQAEVAFVLTVPSAPSAFASLLPVLTGVGRQRRGGR